MKTTTTSCGIATSGDAENIIHKPDKVVNECIEIYLINFNAAMLAWNHGLIPAQEQSCKHSCKIGVIMCIFVSGYSPIAL